MNCFKRFRNRALALLAGSLPVAAFAGGGGIDYSPISDAVDFGDMSTVVLAVAGGLAGIYVLIKGVRVALGFLRGA